MVGFNSVQNSGKWLDFSVKTFSNLISCENISSLSRPTPRQNGRGGSVRVSQAVDHPTVLQPGLHLHGGGDVHHRGLHHLRLPPTDQLHLPPDRQVVQEDLGPVLSN